MVSIICPTYNHAPFLRRTLDGFLAQSVNFDLEILVHDDASDDATIEILSEYANDRPDIFRPFFRKQNLRNKGIALFEMYTRQLFPEAKGKYLAICEGDDYWTDPMKLQKQIDFLEGNPDFSICFHHAAIQQGDVIDNEGHHRNTGFALLERDQFSLTDLLAGNFIQNCTVVYRNLHISYPVLFDNLLLPDWPLHLVHARYGKIKYLPDIMAVHRIHNKGLWNGLSSQEQAFHASMVLHRFMEYLDESYHPAILRTLSHYQ